MAHPPLGFRPFGLGVAAGLAWCRLRMALPRVELAWLLEQLLEERERWFMWLPVGVGLGIAVYFALPFEPPAWLGAGLLVPPAMLTGHLWMRPAHDGRSTARVVLLALAGVAAGFAAAQFRTQIVEAPALERRGAYVIEARVELVEQRELGRRLTVSQAVFEDVPFDAAPVRLRFTTRGNDPELEPGDRVRARVLLMPPSPPAAPGDFDFARHAFFEQLGAVGYALGEVERVSLADRATLAQHIAMVRQHVAQQISEALPGTTGAVANALLTGLRAAIPDAVWRDMQSSGLAHLLAISGLHLSLVAGTVFFAARIGIALAPPLALRVPGKKLAAATALLGAFGYLLLSGGTVPTQRAFIMTSLALLAVMLDRNPFSMRLVAWAALVVLLFRPESLLGASFQMSFAAVIALIAVYETGIGRRPEGAAGLDWRILLYIAGVAITTIVASAATAPFAVYHFERLPTYGIAANLIAVPLTAFWIMPLGLAGILLIPFDLEALCFVPMGNGIDLVLALAAATADLPGAALGIAKPPDVALVLTALGGLWLCLWRRPWRRLGLLGPGLGFLVALLAAPPDLLVDRWGQLVAVRLDDGRVAISPWRRDAWVTDGWLRRMGQGEAAAWPEPGAAAGEALRCDPLGCVVFKNGLRVAIARRAEALEEDCTEADLVIGYPRLETCPNGAPLIGPDALADAGGLALWIGPRGIETLSVREDRGERPWAR